MTYCTNYDKLGKQRKNFEWRVTMAKKVTEKKPLAGNKRSHSLRATKHAQKPNLQVVSINGKKVRMSAREKRTLDKLAA